MNSAEMAKLKQKQAARVTLASAYSRTEIFGVDRHVNFMGIPELKKLRNRLTNKFLYKVLPRIVDKLTVAATLASKHKLESANVERLLIDNTVLAHSVTHETAWVDTGNSLWGGELEVNTGYAARIPVHSDDDASDAAQSIRYLPGIVSLAQRGYFKIAISDELHDEQFTQPVGRFRGYGYYDYSLFSELELEVIQDPDYFFSIGSYPYTYPSLKAQRKKRLDAKNDPLFRNLVSALGPKNSQDAWHITTAEHNNCYCFLTMDFRLIRNIEAQSNNKSLRSLKTRVMTPEQFGQEFGITPIPTRLFSYHNASFPVIYDENWPDSKRNKPNR